MNIRTVAISERWTRVGTWGDACLEAIKIRAVATYRSLASRWETAFLDAKYAMTLAASPHAPMPRKIESREAIAGFLISRSRRHFIPLYGGANDLSSTGGPRIRLSENSLRVETPEGPQTYCTGEMLSIQGEWFTIKVIPVPVMTSARMKKEKRK